MTILEQDRLKRAASAGLGVGGAFALIALIRGTALALATRGVPWIAVPATVALNFALFGGSTFILFATGALWRAPADGTLKASPWFVGAVSVGVIVFLAGVLINIPRLGAAALDRAFLWEEIWGTIVVIAWLAARGWRRGNP